MVANGPYVTDDGRVLSPDEVIARLTPFISEERRERIAAVVAARAFDVLPVLERVHDMGNVNAVLRSTEGLGYGAAGLVDLQGDAADWAARSDISGTAVTGTRGAAKRQSQGADKWIDIHVWDSAAEAVRALRERGFRIAATHLHADALLIDEVDFTIPTAIVLGNEAEGVSTEMRDAADINLVLPIDGFIQSYNISVAAALALYHARADRIRRRGTHSDLDAHTQRRLEASYYLRATKHADDILRRSMDGSVG